MKKIIITGGNDFIGRSIVKNLLSKGYKVYNIDKITYASKKSKLIIKNNNYKFFKKDILNTNFLNHIFNTFKHHNPNITIAGYISFLVLNRREQLYQSHSQI